MNETAAKRNTGNHGQAFNVLFTMLLFLVFVLCALFTVLIGGRVYENINARSQDNFTGSVALQYVANKVRQGDIEGAVRVREVENTPVLELESRLEGGNYVTWIYYHEGSICELFTDPSYGLGLADGLNILECDGFSVSQSEDGKLIHMETGGAGGGELTLALRSDQRASYPAEDGQTGGGENE